MTSAVTSQLRVVSALFLLLALAITAFGHVSGGHFNPAVSAGLAIAGKFPSREVIPYWVAQLVGGFVAVLVMAIVYSSQVTDALGTQPGSGIDDWAALVLEIVATGLFVGAGGALLGQLFGGDHAFARSCQC